METRSSPGFVNHGEIMRHVAIAALLFLVSPVVGQDVQVLPAESQPRKMLYNHLLAEAQKHFDARRLVVADLKTPEEIKKRQQELKAKFIAALGGFPQKTPLNPKVVGTLKADGFRVEKVIYESRPDHHVTGNLYIPDGKGPFPGVLLPCGHSANGKAAEAYQRAAILMATNGLAVLCYDPIGQGERIQLLDKNGKPAIPGSTSEHTMVGIGSLLVGRSTASYRIWDGIRSMDYLASRPEVDAKRLGCTGNSGGGTLTAYLMALDERIVAAAPSCYITSLERLFATIGPQDAEQNITGQVAFGMEHADYLTMRAPLPTLVCIGTQDFFDHMGAWTSFREAKLIYGQLGYGERVDIFEYNDKHGFSKPRREAAMRWMRRWLLHKDDAPFEDAFSVFKDADLQCTRSGQVLEDFKGKSVFHLNAEYGRDLAEKRRKPLVSDQLRQEARRLLGLPQSVALSAEVRKKNLARGFDAAMASVSKGEQQPVTVLESYDKFPLPVRFQAPRQPAKNRALVIYLHEAGMNADAAALGKLAEEGKIVMALELRGMGETAPGVPSPKKPSYFGVDSKEAFLGLHLNRPLLGQRVADVLAIVDCFAGKEKEVHVIGVGSCGPIALHAAALDPRITSVTLENSLVSWSSILETPITYKQLANVVPGALKTYDLPDLAAAISPRPLTIRGAMDGQQRPVSQADLDRAYASARASYGKQGAAAKLTLEAGR
jgi:cephalosporin-C deacetylase-like acetyl esterase